MGTSIKVYMQCIVLNEDVHFLASCDTRRQDKNKSFGMVFEKLLPRIKPDDTFCSVDRL